MTIAPIVMWFRQDLRVADNPALTHAMENGAPVIALYVLDEVTPGTWAPGGASRWWLHGSLGSLQAALKARGIPLVLRRGAARKVLSEVVAETGATRVVASRCYEPFARDLEKTVHDDLTAMGVAFARYAGSLLFDPDQVRTKTNVPYKVYTPFWRMVSGSPQRSLATAPPKQTGIAPPINSDKLEDWRLLPSAPDWASGLRAAWVPGEAGALARLEAFLQTGLQNYDADRNRPDRPGTSQLSPHLRFGEISPATCWHRAAAFAAGNARLDKGLETFLKELVWREFSYHLLYHWPSLPEAPFKTEYARFPWSGTAAQLSAWQRGKTGFPIVDAGMRQLWATGWMHNRVRMIVGSVLVKDLLIDWRAGEAWFWDCLVDADLASNAASWQWVAGSGADAAPFFRIFNPQKQGETYDPDGAYVRRWIPELARLPDKFLHAPATASSDVLARAGVILGKTYPRPMVDHGLARNAALQALSSLKTGADGRALSSTAQIE